MADHFLIFGHRGSPRRFSENTTASFEEALNSGADGFETDLRLTADDEAVLFHDDEIGERVFESLNFADLKRPVARVADLRQFAGRGTMILEVKRGKWEDRLVRELAGWQDIVIASFDHSVIATLAGRHVPFSLGLTVYGFIVDLPAYARRLGATWLFPGYRYVDAKLVATAKADGLKVVPWTPNRPDEWDVLRAMGCDGVITDVPADAVAWRGR